MKAISRALVAAAILSLAARLAVARSAELREPRRTEVVALDATKVSTLTQMRRAIITGGTHHGWKPIADKPGLLTLTAATGAHVVVVDVAYDEHGFQVKFKSSENLDQAQSADNRVTIHPKVNRWLADLNEDIRSTAVAALGLPN